MAFKDKSLVLAHLRKTVLSKGNIDISLKRVLQWCSILKCQNSYGLKLSELQSFLLIDYLHQWYRWKVPSLSYLSGIQTTLFWKFLAADVFRIWEIGHVQRFHLNPILVYSLATVQFKKDLGAIIHHPEKVFLSRQVVFDENVFPYADPSSLFSTSQGGNSVTVYEEFFQWQP